MADTDNFYCNRVDVYDCYPRYQSPEYTLRLVEKGDCDDLLKVYSDKKAVPFFNSDNCYGDNFYYTTREEMMGAIDFWQDKFRKKEFVRMAIVENAENEVVGTVEVFKRVAKDDFTDSVLLRLDLRSDYETEEEISKILKLFIEYMFGLFDCAKIATKAIPEACERIKALRKIGFDLSDKKLIGHDGTEYDNYYVKEKVTHSWDNPSPISETDENYFYDFIDNQIRFCPSVRKNDFLLPFSLNRPFAVYDISEMTDEQIMLLYELVPTAFAECLQEGHKIYSYDWQHNLFLYDPRNPENCQGNESSIPLFNADGIAIFEGLYPDGDYYFHIDKYGAFGYLAHPWREEVWIFGGDLLKEFEKIQDKIGFVPKAILK